MSKSGYITVSHFPGKLGSGTWSHHSTAIDCTGFVYAWGEGSDGQLGNGVPVDLINPVKVLKGAYHSLDVGITIFGEDSTDIIVATAQGQKHTIGLAENGLVYVWGDNAGFQIGDETTIDSYYPKQPKKGAYAGTQFLGDDPTNKIVAVSAGGDFYNLALAEDGMVYAWGTNTNGQLGDGTQTTGEMPVKVVNGEYNGTAFLGDDPNNKIIAISAGYRTAIALAADGSVYCWGLNSGGECGDGTFTTPRLTPVRVKKGEYYSTSYLGEDPGNKIIAISAAVGFAGFALAEDGTIYSWGQSANGRLGNGLTTPNQNTPVRVHKGADYTGTDFLGDTPGNEVISVRGGNIFTLALTADGCVYSWGTDASGQLGNGVVTGDKTEPVKVVMGDYTGTQFLGDDPANKIIQVEAGDSHGMALGTDLLIYVWGLNNVGQLGDSTNVDRDAPVRVRRVGTLTDLALPVELSSFTAQTSDCQVILKWVTQSEIENLGFILERSGEEDGQYMELSSFRNNPGLEGQGNSTHAKEYSFVDNTVENGVTYYYRLADADINGVITYHEPLSVTLVVLPKVFQLYQNYPNPFNPETTIKYDIPSLKGKSVQVALTIYNMLGQIVRNVNIGQKSAGVHTITWNGSDNYGRRMSSGIYFMVFRAGDFQQIRKMMLMQ